MSENVEIEESVQNLINTVAKDYDLDSAALSANYAVKLEELVAAGVTEPYSYEDGTNEDGSPKMVVITPQELALNSARTMMVDEKGLSGNVILYLGAFGNLIQGKNKPFRALHCLVNLEGLPKNALNMFKDRPQKNGVAYVQILTFTSKISPVGFYSATLKRKGQYVSLSEEGLIKTDKTFDILKAEEANPIRFFTPLEVFRPKDKVDGQGREYKSLYMTFLTLRPDGAQELVAASTRIPEWTSLSFDKSATYIGIFEKRKTDKGEFTNLVTPPIKSPRPYAFTIDNLAGVWRTGRFDDVESHIKEYAVLTGFSGCEVQVSENATTGRKTAFAGISDAGGNDVKLVGFNHEVLVNAATNNGKLPPMIRALVRLSEYNGGVTANVLMIEPIQKGSAVIQEAGVGSKSSYKPGAGRDPYAAEGRGY